ncbi:MAG: hypothetical protein GF315_10385 [candidate division Zixibacteria bacterium]|nr:hypothetical protein [candidate division Zixibacteria bacterium]
MKRNVYVRIIIYSMFVLLAIGCSNKDSQVVELQNYPLDGLAGVITKANIELDKEISSDGNGALLIHATEHATIRLIETGDIDVEQARLIYKAQLKTEDFQGQAYLEMLCHFPGKGEFFSRDLQSPIRGSTDWVSEETPFYLRKGENPDNVKLNLVIEGSGTVWIDNIKLLKASL